MPGSPQLSSKLSFTGLGLLNDVGMGATRQGALRRAERVCVKTAKGHAFRRAVGGRVKKPALAAEAFNPQGLKALSYFGPLSARMNPCPFALPKSKSRVFAQTPKGRGLWSVCFMAGGGPWLTLKTATH